MPETPSSLGEFNWLQAEYGINFYSLDREQQALVKQLGQSGLKALVEQYLNSREYRGNRVSLEEASNLAESISRLVDTSFRPRFVGPGSRRVRNSPETWINEEYNDLGNPDKD